MRLVTRCETAPGIVSKGETMGCTLYPFLFLATISIAGVIAGMMTKIPPIENGQSAHFAQMRLKAVGMIAAVGGGLGAIVRLPTVVRCLLSKL